MHLAQSFWSDVACVWHCQEGLVGEEAEGLVRERTPSSRIPLWAARQLILPAALSLGGRFRIGAHVVTLDRGDLITAAS